MQKWLGVTAVLLFTGCAAPHQFGTISKIHNGGLLLPFSERVEPTCAMRAQGCQKPQLRPVAAPQAHSAAPQTHAAAPQTHAAPVVVVPAIVPEADADHDGVLDSLDRCPNTPQGTAVDLNGCPLPVTQPEKVSVTLAIGFDTGKADIKPRDRDQVQRVVDFMKTNPATTVEIEGHTDNVGAAKSNTALSQRRANAVRKAIIAAGIDASRLTAKGYGPEKPIADNATLEGRAKNRRVVATVTANKH